MNNESFWTVVGGVIVTVIGAAVAGYMKLSGLWHSQEGDNSARMVKEYQGVTEQQRITIADLRNENHDSLDRIQLLTNQLTLCQTERARLEERVSYYEDMLSSRDIKFRPYRASDASAGS